MNQNIAPLTPELAIAISAICGLLAGSWLPRRRQWVVRLLAAAGCLVALAATSVAMTRPPVIDFGTSYAIDVATNTVRVIVLAATLLVICLSIDTVHSHPRETEFYVLLQLAALGTIALAGSNDLLMLFAAYLLASIPSYALAGFFKDSLATEAALKYYLIGALLGVVMLTGVALLYGVGRTTSYPDLHSALGVAPHGVVAVGVIAVLAGLLFKAGAVPAHFWVPDVTEGTSTPAAAFLTTVPKIGALAAMLRMLTVAIPTTAINWPLLIAVLAAATMTLGNFAAFFQTSVKRLLAYSTISQVGYLLMAVAAATHSPLAAKSLLYYLGAYAVTNLGAFAVIATLPRARTIADYAGMGHRHPGLAAVLVVCLLGLVGTPPTGVFIGKLEVFTATIDGGFSWLVVIAAINTVASLFYYLRWLAPVFTRLEQPQLLQPAGRWSTVGAYSAGVASLAIGVAGGVILPIVTGRLTS
jgi:NADH-quinone oxidoreductase subunit N